MDKQAGPLVIGSLVEDPSDLQDWLLVAVANGDQWPVGQPVGIRSTSSGNLIGVGLVQMSKPGAVQVSITERFE